MKKCFCVMIILLAMICAYGAEAADASDGYGIDDEAEPTETGFESDLTEEQAVHIATEYFKDCIGLSDFAIFGFNIIVSEYTQDDCSLWDITFKYRSQIDRIFMDGSQRGLCADFFVQIDARTKEIMPYSSGREYINEHRKYQQMELSVLYRRKTVEAWCIERGTPWQRWSYEDKAAFCTQYGMSPVGVTFNLSEMPEEHDTTYFSALLQIKKAIETYVPASADSLKACQYIDHILNPQLNEEGAAKSDYFIDARFRSMSSQRINKGWEVSFYEAVDNGEYRQVYHAIVRSPESDLYVLTSVDVRIADNGDYVSEEQTRQETYYSIWQSNSPNPAQEGN